MTRVILAGITVRGRRRRMDLRTIELRGVSSFPASHAAYEERYQNRNKQNPTHTSTDSNADFRRGRKTRVGQGVWRDGRRGGRSEGADYPGRRAGGIPCRGSGRGNVVVLPKDGAPRQDGKTGVGLQRRAPCVEDMFLRAVWGAAGERELHEVDRVVVPSTARPVGDVCGLGIAVEVLAGLVDGDPFLIVKRRRLVQTFGRGKRRVGASGGIRVAGC